MKQAPASLKRESADVVVVGGGGSGMAAAIAAAEAGAKVILLEKNPHLGGTTRLSVGSITATGTRFQKAKGIHDTPDEHYEDMSLFLSPELQQKENLELRRVLVDHVPETLEWLIRIGLCFYGPMPEPPHQKPRMHNVLPNSRAYAYYLEKECRRLGVDIRLNARAQRLVMNGDAVAGIVADAGQGPVEFRARGGVILASGDFSAGTELKKTNVPHVAHVDAINPASTGDGHVIAQQVGGWIRNPEVMWGPSMRFKAPPVETLLRRLPPSRWITKPMQFALMNLPLWMFRPFVTRFMTASLAPEPSLLRAGAILVNRRGERFADELARPELEVPKQPDKEAFLVFDGAVGERFQRWPDFVSTAPGVAYAYLKDYQRTRPDLYHEAPTLDALARQMGVPAEALRKAVDGHNESLPGGDTRQPIRQGPFYALGPVMSWIVFTEGGLAVTARHEVTTPDGRQIPGLFAAGSAGQGGTILAGHGHHIGWAMTSGRRAGRFAAERARTA
ncbi:FAD-dependent oxidoreductase [Hydrogenophaga sp.]|uniref:FAD-dependent oxidoreductase n=1 Tax=Hydrogenophaga sp. TaxID=1904254 RepID=UPI002629A50D|nr:FAD-dependent oxidoreductase [Hydrogenophaga sp.]MCW5656014.1 FAD-dependent oxidoreductase [Hydrogenophaga sp.]